MSKLKEKILIELYKSRKSFWEILEKEDFLLKDFIEAIEDLHEKGLIKTDCKNLIITEKGRKFVNKRATFFIPRVCDKCHGKKIILDKKFKEILKKYKKIIKERPLPTKEFFQGYMEEQSVIARAAFMHLNNDLNNKKIILIGDDDLLSVALALTELPKRIVVLDIDERIGDFLNKLNKKYKFEIEFQKYDVSFPLEKRFVSKFDVFSSEPLETISGLKAFILRGVSCLKENSSGYFGLTRAEASLKKWLEIEKFLTKMNCVITDLITGFSIYPTLYENVSYEDFSKRLSIPIPKNPGINWYKSALFRFEVIGKPKLIFSPFKKLKISFVDKEEDLTIF